ncbi:hypothetical protein MTO96_015222 [Rhipicephalus appendiculatus]
MYKIGPVLSVSHGMGSPSLSIVMHELLKLLHYSHCTSDVVMLRLGTCGGIGVPPGSVVVSTAVMNGLLQEELEVFILGERVRRPCVLDGDLVRELVDVGNRFLPAVHIVRGKTLSTDDFYEGQARLDGAFCTYTEKAKRQFMEKLRSMGVRNIEMEASQFAAMCHFAGLKGGVVCVTLLDRLEGGPVKYWKKDVVAVVKDKGSLFNAVTVAALTSDPLSLTHEAEELAIAVAVQEQRRDASIFSDSRTAIGPFSSGFVSTAAASIVNKTTSLG